MAGRTGKKDRSAWGAALGETRVLEASQTVLRHV